MAKAPRENRVPIMMSAEELAAIDEWRYARHIATRSDAIRRLAKNALWIEDEIAEIAERADDLYELIWNRYVELGDFISQWRDPEATPTEISPPEALERMRSWLSAVEEDLHVLSLQTLGLNNRVVSVVTAPHLRGAIMESKRAVEAAEERQKNFLRRREEYIENEKLMIVSNEMTEADRVAYDQLSEDEKDTFLRQRMAKVELPDPLEEGSFPESIYAKRRRGASS